MDVKHNRVRITFFLLMVLSAVGNLFAYEVSVGQESVFPGGTVAVPVLLDDATDVAVVQFQINYDPQLLTLVSLTNAPATLGSQFALDVEDDDGVLIVILYREDSLLSGSGELVSIMFEANSGAEVQMESALLLAEVSLSNHDGKDLSWVSSVTALHGLLQVMPPSDLDSDGDGIPDQWELQYSDGATNLIATIDPDGDGFDNFHEYIAGTNPTNYDPFAVSHIEQSILDPQDIILRWNGVSGRVYNIYWTTNLLDGFTQIQTNVSWAGGCFTDRVHHVESTGFYKVDVQLKP